MERTGLPHIDKHDSLSGHRLKQSRYLDEHYRQIVEENRIMRIRARKTGRKISPTLNYVFKYVGDMRKNKHKAFLYNKHEEPLVANFANMILKGKCK